MLSFAGCILESEQGLFFVSQRQDLLIEHFGVVTDCCWFRIALIGQVDLVGPFVSPCRYGVRRAVIQRT